ncbi:ApeP family dehydratase [Salinibius halmophilus]|uniref:ApeP family dehydratase n=1 Tax=Salinibius halmophilus TaxID=1853216 RepID=UPI000E6659E4|nr:hypothetical protein [Salinibius halmophilus]
MQQNWDMDDLLPHRAPMQLVHDIAVLDDQITVIAKIEPDHIFADDSGVPAWVASEIMAQAIAAQTSYLDKQTGAGGVKGGMLLAVKRFKANHSYMKFGETLNVTSEALSDEGAMKLFKCQVEGPSFTASAMLSVIQTAE